MAHVAEPEAGGGGRLVAGAWDVGGREEEVAGVQEEDSEEDLAEDAAHHGVPPGVAVAVSAGVVVVEVFVAHSCRNNQSGYVSAFSLCASVPWGRSYRILYLSLHGPL